jgi:hypothetical protein
MTMGGFGSGRQGGKTCTGDMLALDVRRLQRAGRLSPDQSFNWRWSRNGESIGHINIHTGTDRVTLIYRQRDRGGEWQAMNYPVRLTWTSCNYGGRRAWWLCPAVGCARRVAVLYGGKVYACRHCYRLAYKSQREAPDDRASRQADKLRDRLGWEAGILNGNGDKPKGMHWRTFERLQASHDFHVNAALAGMAAKFGMLRGRLEDVG